MVDCADQRCCCGGADAAEARQLHLARERADLFPVDGAAAAEDGCLERLANEDASRTAGRAASAGHAANIVVIGKKNQRKRFGSGEDEKACTRNNARQRVAAIKFARFLKREAVRQCS